MSNRLNPRESGRFVTTRARHVSINSDAVTSLTELIADAAQAGRLGADSFKYNNVFPAHLSLEQLLNWTFMVDAINFSFWTPDKQPKFTVTHKNVTRQGYLGMVTAVNRAIAEGEPIYDPSYYRKLSIDDLGRIFRSDTSSAIPLLEERLRVLNSIGQTLHEKYKGSFTEVLNKCNLDAVKLVHEIISNFEPFQDFAIYDDKPISLLKRAQIVVADVDLILANRNKPCFKNIDQLTMFADYRVPQVLLFYGVLSYSNRLMKDLQKEHLFPSGSSEEVEIRACSIEAVERLVASAHQVLVGRGLSLEDAKSLVNSIKVDFFLWDYRVQHAKQLSSVPYHRTRCIYY